MRIVTLRASERARERARVSSPRGWFCFGSKVCLSSFRFECLLDLLWSGVRVLEGWPRTSVVISCRATLTLNKQLGDAAASAVLLPIALMWLFASPPDSVPSREVVGRGEAR